MSTDIRPEISKKNKYWISKHRYYELRHFCLQYPDWKKAYSKLELEVSAGTSKIESVGRTSDISDPTARLAILQSECFRKIEMIEKAAVMADEELSLYILKAVTEATPVTYLQTVMGMPCSRDTFYDRYRKFFWILSSARG